jgi:hypothetical protein
MRYIIHLLPDERQRRAYDDARARVADEIGHNRALEYPTAHITLVWAIQDTPDDPAPIAQETLLAALERWRGTGAIPLTVREPVDTREHLLLPLTDTAALAKLRHTLYLAAQTITAGPAGDHAERAAKVREQTWPHLTLAQEIDAERWERGMALLKDDAALLHAPLHCTELALVARDIDAGEPYRIVGRVPLDSGEVIA